MEVTDRIVESVRAAGPPDAGWFAARQPGIVRYLETRFGAGSDALSVALEAAGLLHAAYEQTLGVPPPRVASGALERAEQVVLGLCNSGDLALAGALGRQPALVELVASTVTAPPLPLDIIESGRVGLALAALVTALDDAIAGRSWSTAEVRPEARQAR